MSYCRFENTLSDLKACFKAIKNNKIESESENEAAKEMLNIMVDFLVSNGIVESWEKTDENIYELIEFATIDDDDF